MTCGFYKQEKGEPLVYTYDYDEVKIILGIEGEYTISDEIGKRFQFPPVNFVTSKKARPSRSRPRVTDLSSSLA